MQPGKIIRTVSGYARLGIYDTGLFLVPTYLNQMGTIILLFPCFQSLETVTDDFVHLINNHKLESVRSAIFQFFSLLIIHMHKKMISYYFFQ